MCKGCCATDEEAARSIEDQQYHAGMVECGRKMADLFNPMCEETIYSGKHVLQP
jgi:hypothetical protein